jgi:hypothetical protein
LSLIICFDLLYLGLLWSHDLDYGFRRLTWVDPGWFNMLSSQYFFKKYVILNFFESNSILTSRSGCLWTHLVDRVILVNSHFFTCVWNWNCIISSWFIFKFKLKLCLLSLYIYIYMNNIIPKQHTEMLWNQNISFQLKNETLIELRIIRRLNLMVSQPFL